MLPVGIVDSLHEGNKPVIPEHRLKPEGRDAVFLKEGAADNQTAIGYGRIADDHMGCVGIDHKEVSKGESQLLSTASDQTTALNTQQHFDILMPVGRQLPGADGMTGVKDKGQPGVGELVGFISVVFHNDLK